MTEGKKSRPARLPRHEMPAQEAKARGKNFSEVALGYTAKTAQAEAGRCIQCKKPLCVTGCPVNVQIPEFLQLICDGDFAGAAAKIKETNSLPAVCGRVCPQETQCEIKCILGKHGEPVAIGRLERFAADYERAVGVPQAEVPTRNLHKVAVIGAGPAGLTCAGDLARLGYSVMMYEALHEPGGVLIYGIPEFRLPKDIVKAEVEYVKSLGVDLQTNVVVARTIMIEQLFEMGFEAVFIGTGAGLPKFMNIPGENLLGVYSANEWLTRINLMKAYLFPQWDTPIRPGSKVVVVGGGNVAMDAVRCALRLGAAEAHIVYRRSRDEMPARAEEVHHAEEEGVIFNLLVNPTQILSDDKGWVKGIECVRMELGEPDSSGRRRPVAVKGSEFVIDCDTVVMALGTDPNPILSRTTPGLEVQSWGGIIVDPATFRTTRDGIWAGGDAVTGAATVIEAMGAGKTAAADMHKWFQEKDGVTPA